MMLEKAGEDELDGEMKTFYKESRAKQYHNKQ